MDARKSDEVEVIAIDEDQLDLDGAMEEVLGAVEAIAPEEGNAEPEEVDPLVSLKVENHELREQSLRALADLENYRKRIARERVEERRYAGQGLLADFLDVKDNLQRALSSEGSADDLKIGVEMTLRQFDQVLERAGVTPVEAVGKAFDPMVHEAVSRVEKEGVEEPVVLEEMQQGYRMHQRLLRPSRVLVAVPVAPIHPEADESSEGQSESQSESQPRNQSERRSGS